MDSDGKGGRPKPFVCGVCEGFYGKPWSTEQRKDLFNKMCRFGLSTYLYAPKDDYKHRLYWRDLYSKEESEDLSELIQSAKEHNVTFVYALSPGLDITYSDKQEVAALKRKLDQMKSLGCTAFALLFDDIEPDLCPEDEAEYETFFSAQAVVTNGVYEHLGQPSVFLFCPTEYCDSRAVPDLTKSDYLRTIGKELLPGIDILWTGPRVVPRRISVESIKEVKRVLCRPPVIWDNLHANDYDQTRIYLGPYDGRPPELVNHLAGVLINPNCEYEANFIAFHTLAQWSRNVTQTFPSITDNKACDNSSKQEEKMEVDQHENGSGYCPKKALACGIQDWIPEFYRPKGSYRHTCMSQDMKDQPKQLTISDKMSPPETRTSPRTRSQSRKEAENCDKKDLKDRKYDFKGGNGKRKIAEIDPLTANDLRILCDLCYLPFEHGSGSVHLLKEAHWLVSHADCLKDCSKLAKAEPSPENRQWYQRAMQFHDMYKDIAYMVDKIVNIPNRVLLYEMYSYVSDMRSVLSMVNSYIKWHGMGKPDREPFRTGEQEPWVHRGGLHAEFRRLLPIEGQFDLFPPPMQLPPSSKVYTIRPYFPGDKADVFMVCRKTCDGGLDGSDIYPHHPDLVADESVGGLLTLCQKHCYVVQDGAGICGYIVCTPDVRQYQQQYVDTWLPQMRQKYKRPTKSTNLTPAEEIIETFYGDVRPIPDKLYQKYPGFVHMSMMSSRIHDMSMSKHLLSVVIQTLKMEDIQGIHTIIHANHINLMALHIRLGFEDITNIDSPEDMLVLAQVI